MEERRETGFSLGVIADQKIGQLTLLCNNPYCLRVSMEIMASLTLKGIFRFLSDGFYIHHCNANKTAIASFKIFEAGLLQYDMSCINNQWDDDEETKAYVNLGRFVEICKSFAKKDSMILTADIFSGRRIDTILCQRHDDNVDRIQCD